MFASLFETDLFSFSGMGSALNGADASEDGGEGGVSVSDGVTEASDWDAGGVEMALVDTVVVDLLDAGDCGVWDLLSLF